MAADFHIKDLYLENLSIRQMEAVTEMWRADKISIDCRNDTRQVMKIDALRVRPTDTSEMYPFQNVKCFSFMFFTCDEDAVLDVVRGRTSVCVNMFRFSTDAVRRVYSNIVEVVWGRTVVCKKLLLVHFFAQT